MIADDFHRLFRCSRSSFYVKRVNNVSMKCDCFVCSQLIVTKFGGQFDEEEWVLDGFIIPEFGRSNGGLMASLVRPMAHIEVPIRVYL
jgi:hypothetical protein